MSTELELCNRLRGLSPARIEAEARFYWMESTRLARQCYLCSPHSASTQLLHMTHLDALDVAELFLDQLDGSSREWEYLEALVPLLVRATPMRLLARELPDPVRALVFVHLLEAPATVRAAGELLLKKETQRVIDFTHRLLDRRHAVGNG